MSEPTDKRAEMTPERVEKLRAAGRKGGLARNPNKGFGSHANRMKAIAGLMAGLTSEERAAVLQAGGEQ